MLSIPHTYYVYSLAYPGGSVFYIGKGTGKRINAHEKEARTNCQCHKCKVIRKIWRSGKEVEKSILFTFNHEGRALAKEAELIQLYSLSNLCNVSPGHTGFIPNPQRFLRPANAVTIRARLRKNHASQAEIYQVMEDWHERQITKLCNERRGAIVQGDAKRVNHLNDMIEAHRVYLEGVNQLELFNSDDML